jgi:hypothetical protein
MHDTVRLLLAVAPEVFGNDVQIDWRKERRRVKHVAEKINIDVSGPNRYEPSRRA